VVALGEAQEQRFALEMVVVAELVLLVMVGDSPEKERENEFW